MSKVFCAFVKSWGSQELGLSRAGASSPAVATKTRRRHQNPPPPPKLGIKSRGLIVGSAYHKNTNAKVERANGVISDTVRG